MIKDEAREALEILCNYRHIDRRVAEIYDRIARYRETATRATASMTAGNISGTPGRSRVETEAIKIVDLEHQLDDTIDDLNARRYAIQRAINAMPNEEHKRMLELRYMDGKQWAVIMRRLSISRSTSYRMHWAALREFYECYQLKDR